MDKNYRKNIHKAKVHQTGSFSGYVKTASIKSPFKIRVYKYDWCPDQLECGKWWCIGLLGKLAILNKQLTRLYTTPLRWCGRSYKLYWNWWVRWVIFISVFLHWQILYTNSNNFLASDFIFLFHTNFAYSAINKFKFSRLQLYEQPPPV